MEVYLDNAATTKPFSEVVDNICQSLQSDYGNPSSLHKKGLSAEKKVNEVKDLMAKLLKIDKKEIFFTSGGTEANNLAILGVSKAYIRSGNHIITSAIEHPSVDNAIGALEEEGYVITTLPVNEKGLIDLKDLRNSIREDTILVSLMHVNNEVGTIQPVMEVGKLIKEVNKKTLFHVDAIQSFGKMKIHPKKCYIDLLSISGHKFHGPKGIGAVYINSGIKIKPVLFGGYQQKGIRSGTENVPGIVGLGTAAKIVHENIEKHVDYMYTLKEYFVNKLMDNIDGVAINGMDILEGAPHILNLRFDDIKGEVLLHALESKGIYVSTGSACSSNKPDKSTTLKAIGLNNEQIDNSIRFSFSIDTNLSELDYCIIQLKEIVPKLRKFVRR